MNGAEHYREAERCLRRSEDSDPQGADLLAKQAQVHATLALFDQVREVGDQLDSLPRKTARAARPKRVGTKRRWSA